MPATVVGETGSSARGAWLVACVCDSSCPANIGSLFCGGVRAAAAPHASHRRRRRRIESGHSNGASGARAPTLQQVPLNEDALSADQAHVDLNGLLRTVV